MDKVDIRIRRAVAADVAVLQGLIEASVWELQAEDYTREQMDGALESVFGVDSQLIADGTYLVAEARVAGARSVDDGGGGGGKTPGAEWVIAGCGGWSK